MTVAPNTPLNAAIQPLLREFPAASALAEDFFRLDLFFTDPVCLDSLVEGRPVALAYGSWLESRASDPAGRAMASLETAMARLRRQGSVPGGPGDRFVLATGAEIIERPSGTFELHAAVLKEVGSDPAGARARGAPRRERLPAVHPASQETLLLVLGDPDGGLRPCRVLKPGHVRSGLLVFAQEPRTRSELQEEARALGSAAEAADALVDGLVSAGLLRRCR